MFAVAASASYAKLQRRFDCRRRLHSLDFFGQPKPRSVPCERRIRGIVPGRVVNYSGNKIYLFFVDAYERLFIRFAPTQIVPGASDHFLTNGKTLYEKKAFFKIGLL